MNILLLDEGERQIPATDRRYRHIRKILKLRQGDTLRTGIINGPAGIGTIESLTPTQVTLRLDPVSGPPTPVPVDIVLGHPRPIVLRRLLRDLTTVGVRSIVVTPTALGERSYLDATMWDNIRSILIDGAEQAGSTRLPDVVRCRSLDEAIEHVRGSEQLRVALHPVGSPSFYDALGGDTPPAGIVVGIGSERGWVEHEINLLTAAGYLLADLGPRILKTETASVVAAWVAVAACTRKRVVPRT